MSAAPRLRACIVISGGDQPQEVLFLYPPARFVEYALHDPAGARAAFQQLASDDQIRQLRACLRWVAWYGWRVDLAPWQFQALLEDSTP